MAEAVRCGWADVGVCLRLVSEEASLGFLSVREEDYDFCYPAELEGDPRIQALVETVRSSPYRGMLDDLPGYDATETGELERIVSLKERSSPVGASAISPAATGPAP